jgi:hypothetical protein
MAQMAAAAIALGLVLALGEGVPSAFPQREVK